MLESLRRASGNWLGKVVLTILFSILILSFAIWGIGDIFRGGVNTAVARVGQQEVGGEAFRRQFQQRITEIQQRTRGFTAEQARALGLDRQILNQLIAEAAVNQKAKALGLGISDQEIARELAAERAFRGPDGRFDRQQLDNYLRNVGLTEAGLIQQQRDGALRRHIGETLTGGLEPPLALREAVHRYQNEERIVAFVTVPGTIPASLELPAEDVLRKLHDERKTAFRAPEYRKLHVMLARPAEFANLINISEADLRALYDRSAATGRFGAPEKRDIQQIIFPDAAAANAASERLKGGLAFDALIAEMKLADADVALGDKARGDIADKAVADAAFALAEGAASAPVNGVFGPVLLRVKKISPGAVQPFEAVRERLAADFAAERLTRDRNVLDHVGKVHDGVEERRSAGKTLEQVAREMNRELLFIEAVDAQGRDKAGQPIPALPDQTDVLTAVFRSDRGVDNEAIRARDNSYVWFEVMAVEPSRERAFDEVKAEVGELWRRDEAQRQTVERAGALLKRVEAGETLDAIATELGALVETLNGLTRDGGRGLSPSAAATAFSLAKDGVAMAAGSNLDRVILKVLGSDTPAFNAEDESSKRMRDQLRTALADEKIDAFVSQLRQSLGVTIDERSLGLATGALTAQR
jgi:peptidyl-prolyl cis-trans isomerase D